LISIDRIDFRIARNRKDLTGAFELLQRRYCEVGLSSSDAKSLRVMPYHLWQQTQVFVAEYRGTVVGTVSLTRDGNRSGVPMESTYSDIINRLRSNTSGFGEVCSLAVESPVGHSSGAIFGQLTRLMTFYSRHIGLESLVATVHPRHGKFYRRAMGFQAVGNPREIDQVGGRPGIPILCKINERERFHPRWQRFYFEADFSGADLDPHPMSPSDALYFQPYLRPVARSDRRAA
jgi:hypothetical protein